MDYFKYDPDRVTGLELLRFDNVELTEKTNHRNTTITKGNLSILFLKDSFRFLLCLNDWKYLLMKRLPVMAYIKHDTHVLSYSLPTIDGLYILRFPQIAHPEAIKNFETILKHNSDFYRQNESMSTVKQESEEIEGPRQRFLTQQLGYKNIGGQTLEIEKVRKRDKFKKKIMHIAQKVTRKFSNEQVKNENLTERKSYQDLIHTKESDTIPHFLLKREVEKATNFGQDVIKRLYQEADESLKQPGYLFSMENIDTNVINGLDRQYSSYQHFPYEKQLRPV